MAGDPYADGYSYAEAGKIVNRSLCRDCQGRLRRVFHDNPPDRLHDWKINCYTDGCPSSGYVSKRYVEVIRETQQAEGQEIVRLHKERIESMPIPASVNTVPSFRELGKIAKGIVVKQNRNGKEVTYPKEVPHLVMKFHDTEAEAAAVFWSEYDRDPMLINIIPPFDKVDDFWDAWFKCYKGGRVVAKAGLNPQLAAEIGADPNQTVFYERLFDVDAGVWIVKKWRTAEGAGRQVDWSLNVDPDTGEGRGEKIYSTKNKKGEVTDYYLKPVGTLRVMVRELVAFQGYLTLHTTGKLDIFHISGELAGLALRAEQSGMPLHKFPMQLFRRLEDGRSPDGKATKHWNFHIRLDPDFSKKLYLKQKAETDLMLTAGDVAALPDPSVIDVSPVEVDPSGDNDEYFDALPGEPKEWEKAKLVRNKDDYVWLYEKAGIDREVAGSIWLECDKDYSTAYDNVLKNYSNPLGLEG